MENSNKFSLKAATYLVLIRESKVLLIRRFNTGWQDGKYSLIAGHLEGSETAVRAMSREAFEEAGINIKDKDLKVAHIMHRKSDHNEYIDFFLIPASWEGEPKIMERNKADDLRWFKISNLPENLLPHVKYALSQINNGNIYSEYNF